MSNARNLSINNFILALGCDVCSFAVLLAEIGRGGNQLSLEEKMRVAGKEQVVVKPSTALSRFKKEHLKN